MQQNYIPFRDTGYFSSLICDYLDDKKELRSFYNRFPKIENFKEQIEEKASSKFVSASHRAVLVANLKKQYQNIEASKATLNNIENLSQQNTFTITTGHQLNLFTGPLYFLYKIVSAINLSEELKQHYPEYNFVPIYWMATEDHDFEEINFFHFKGKKIQWHKDTSGAVGTISTEGLEAVFNLFSQNLGHTKQADYIKNIFKTAYLKHTNLADATRFLANELFKNFGLVIIDANDADLKKLYSPFIEDELLNQTSFNAVSQTNDALKKTYKIQVNPREINLFYLKGRIRERIVKENTIYKVTNTEITFTKSEILNEVKTHPEHFSPNVIMRPLYQEVILPNLCYIGGGGELAYWFQLKEMFKKSHVTFPILLLRNSVLIQSESQSKKRQKLHISNHDIFLKQDKLINKKTKELSDIDIDFSSQKNHLRNQFEALYSLASQTDKSFLGAVKAQETKQIKGLNNLEKRLLKAQKKKLVNEIKRIVDIKNELFPNDGLQERNTNFSEFYLEYGEELMVNLITNLKPLQHDFLIVNL